MLRLADSEANKVLDNLLYGAVLSLHQGVPGNTGANEVSGGSYARQASNWAAAASRSKATNADVQFQSLPEILPTNPANFVGIWKGPEVFFTAATTDTFTSYGHGYSDDDQVRVYGGALPTGLSVNTTYYIINSTSNTFQVSTSQGGSAVNITADGEGIMTRISGTLTFRGYLPTGGSRDEFTALASSDTFTSYAHGLADDDQVILVSRGAGLPTGVSEETIYYVITSATNTFQLSTSEGGAAINLTADGEGIVVKLAGQFVSSGGEIFIGSGNITATI